MTMRTRGARGADYTLITPGNHYASRLPNLPGAEVYKLVTPRVAPARIGQYLLVIGDETAGDIRPGFENFLFGLEGRVRIRCDAGEFVLAARSYAYVPASSALTLESEGPGRLLWIKPVSTSPAPSGATPPT
jgi:(S)-ureidoglycine aminohydrolase